MAAVRKIHYFTPSFDVPRGGIKQSYRHVEILCRHGHDAAVLHRKPNFRVTWFDSDAPVVSLAKFRATHREGEDIVVVPEDLGREILRFPRRRVIFNQNVYYGFVSLEDDCQASPYLDDDTPVITVSDHNRDILQFAYPTLPIERVHCGIDAERFESRPLRSKKKQIVCPGRKGRTTNLTLLQMLMSRASAGRNQLDGFEWIFLGDRSEAQVATLLAESMFFVFASVEEGFGLLPAEALLSGCVVLTHASGPQRDFVPEPFLFGDHDVVAMAQAIESVAAADDATMALWQRRCDDGAERIRTEHSLEREEASVLAAWGRILGRWDGPD